MSNKAPKLSLRPAAITVTIDGVSLTKNDWTTTEHLLKHQSRVYGGPINVHVADADGTELGTYTVADEAVEGSSRTAKAAAVTFSHWQLLAGEHLVADFADADSAMRHVQHAATGSGQRIDLDVFGVGDHTERSYTPEESAPEPTPESETPEPEEATTPKPADEPAPPAVSEPKKPRKRTPRKRRPTPEPEATTEAQEAPAAETVTEDEAPSITVEPEPLAGPVGEMEGPAEEPTPAPVAPEAQAPEAEDPDHQDCAPEETKEPSEPEPVETVPTEGQQQSPEAQKEEETPERHPAVDQIAALHPAVEDHDEPTHSVPADEPAVDQHEQAEDRTDGVTAQADAESEIITSDAPAPEPVAPVEDPEDPAPDAVRQPHGSTATPRTEPDTEPGEVTDDEGKPLPPSLTALLFHNPPEARRMATERPRDGLTPIVRLVSTRAGRALAGAGILTVALGLGLAGLSAVNSPDSQASTPATHQITTTSQTKTIPDGYMTSPAWTQDIPDGAKVFGTEAAVAILEGKKITLYDPADGKKIREITLDHALDLAKGDFIIETHIGDKPAIAWRSGTTVQAWTETQGQNKDLIKTTVPASARVSATGTQAVLIDGTKAWQLTNQGKTELPTSSGLTPMGIDDDGLIAVGYDVPLTITPTNGGTARSLNLVPPHDGQRVAQFLNAGNGYIAAIWATNPEAPADTDPVTVAMHSLKDGKVTGSVETTYKDARMKTSSTDGLTWIDGQEQREAAYGPWLFDQTNGHYLGATEGQKIKKIKGNLAVAEDGHTVYESDHPGYRLTSAVIAETPSAVILQQGNRVVAYNPQLS